MALKGIVIDPGHGGTDPGASGNGIIEKDLNLLISKYMYDRLRELGIPVKLTRETDETVSPDERVNRILNSFGNTKDVIVVSNHINAGGVKVKNEGILFNIKLLKRLKITAEFSIFLNCPKRLEQYFLLC